MTGVLVTGGSGFIGSRLIRHIAGHDIRNIDLANDEDIRDPETASTIAEYDPEVAFLLAARHYVPWCREHPAETRSVNVDGTAATLRHLGPSVRTIVLASSAAVYGFSDQAATEHRAFDPQDIYGETKVEGEALLRSYAREHPSVRCIAARLFNVVGAGDRTDHVVPAIARKLAAGQSELVLGNIWPMRDYVHVADVAAALTTLAFGEAPSGAYNVATGRGTTVAQLVEMFSAITGAPITVAGVDTWQRDLDGHLVGDATKLNAETGWRPTHSLETAITDALYEAAL